MNSDLLSELVALSRLLRGATDPQTMTAIASTIASLTTAASSLANTPSTASPAGAGGWTPGTVTPFGTVGVKDLGNPAKTSLTPATAPLRVVPMSDQDAYVNGDNTRASAKAAAWAAQQLAHRASAVLGPDGYIDVRLARYPGPVPISDVRTLWNPSGNGLMNAALVYRDFAYGDGEVSLSDLRTALGSPVNPANLAPLSGIDPEFRARVAS